MKEAFLNVFRVSLLVPVEEAHPEHGEERLLHLLVGALKVVAAGVGLLLGGEGLVEMPSLAVLRDVFPVVISDPRFEITYKNISACLLRVERQGFKRASFFGVARAVPRAVAGSGPAPLRWRSAAFRRCRRQTRCIVVQGGRRRRRPVRPPRPTSLGGTASHCSLFTKLGDTFDFFTITF